MARRSAESRGGRGFCGDGSRGDVCCRGVRGERGADDSRDGADAWNSERGGILFAGTDGMARGR